MPPGRKIGVVSVPAKRAAPDVAGKDVYKGAPQAESHHLPRASKRLRGQPPSIEIDSSGKQYSKKQASQPEAVPEGKTNASNPAVEQVKHQEANKPNSSKKKNKPPKVSLDRPAIEPDLLPPLLLSQPQVPAFDKTLNWVRQRHRQTRKINLPPEHLVQTTYLNVMANQNPNGRQNSAPIGAERGAKSKKSKISVKGLIEWLGLQNADPMEATPDPQMHQGHNFQNLMPTSGHVAGERTSIAEFDELDRRLRQILVSDTQGSTVTDRARKVKRLAAEFEEWKSRNGFIQISSRHFHEDAKRCGAEQCNEYTLHGTLMVDLIDRFSLDPRLDFLCESEWKFKFGNSFAYEVNSNSKKGLRADLAMFFTLNALTGVTGSKARFAPPEDLKIYMAPDGHPKRCFPFLFIEAKRRGDPLESAKAQTMMVASQALWNIYKWMKKADNPQALATERLPAHPDHGKKISYGKHMTAFWDDVRVFSFSMNATTLSARIHRAIPLEVSGEPAQDNGVDSQAHSKAIDLEAQANASDSEALDGATGNKGQDAAPDIETDGLDFVFDEFKPVILLDSANPEQVCGLVHNITRTYVLKTLLPCLQSAYRTVLRAKQAGDYCPEPIQTPIASTTQSVSATTVDTPASSSAQDPEGTRKRPPTNEQSPNTYRPPKK